MAYVSYNRVERIARTYLNAPRRRAMDDIDTVIVLAHAMAHEVGHLLLPHGHSATGLMRAGWDGQNLRLAVRAQLKFTPEQAELIRARLTRIWTQLHGPVSERALGSRPAGRHHDEEVRLKETHCTGA